MTALAAAPGFLLALLVAAAIFQFGARRVYDYAVTPTALEIRLFGRLAVYRVAIADIVVAAPWRFSAGPAGSLFTTLRLGNRIVGPAIVIERRARFPRYIVITPDDLSATLKALNAGA